VITPTVPVIQTSGIPELVIVVYNSITKVMQIVKSNMDSQQLVDSIVKVITAVTKVWCLPILRFLSRILNWDCSLNLDPEGT